MMKHLKQHLKGAAIAGFAMLFSPFAQAAELVMVEAPGCVWCEQWNLEISATYPKTPEGMFAPLQRMQITETRTSDLVKFQRPVVFTPTFVLVENGRELSRIEGYPGEDFFWGLLEMMLTATTEYQGETG